MTRRLVVCLTAMVALVAGSCGDDAGTPDAAGTDPIEVGEQYLRALAGQGDRSLDDVVALASPDSVADRYARHTRALRDIQVDAGESPEAVEVTVTGARATVTFTPDGGAPVATEWADFQLGGDGLLSSFTIDGVSLEGRLLGSGEPHVVDGVSARILSGFHLVTSGRPLVIVEIANEAEGTYVLGSAAYRTSDGSEFATSPSGDALGVPSAGSNRVALIFDEADFGGSVMLDGDLDGAPVGHELEVDP